MQASRCAQMKKILILVDIQKEYITPGRPFFLNGIEPSLENCRRLLVHARKNHWELIHIQHSNGSSAARFNPTDPHFDFVEGFEPIADEKRFVKTDFSCYSKDRKYFKNLEKKLEIKFLLPHFKRIKTHFMIINIHFEVVFYDSH